MKHQYGKIWIEDKRGQGPHRNPVVTMFGEVAIPANTSEVLIADENGNPITFNMFAGELVLKGPAMDNSDDQIALRRYYGGYNSGDNWNLTSDWHDTDDTGSWQSGDTAAGSRLVLNDWHIKKEDDLVLVVSAQQSSEKIIEFILRGM